jgi:putative Holliday junction resolvase
MLDGPSFDRKALTVLSFDFGLKRIGIAVGDTVTCTAAPRPAVGDWAGVEREIRRLQPQALVVGAPSGASAIAKAAGEFASQLEKAFRLPVYRVDERFSSVEGSAVLKARRQSGERRRRVRKEDIDSAAAVVILERWFAGEQV